MRHQWHLFDSNVFNVHGHHDNYGALIHRQFHRISGKTHVHDTLCPLPSRRREREKNSRRIKLFLRLISSFSYFTLVDVGPKRSTEFMFHLKGRCLLRTQWIIHFIYSSKNIFGFSVQSSIFNSSVDVPVPAVTSVKTQIGWTWTAHILIVLLGSSLPLSPAWFFDEFIVSDTRTVMRYFPPGIQITGQTPVLPRMRLKNWVKNAMTEMCNK